MNEKNTIPYLVPILWGLSAYLGGIFSPKSQGLFTGFFWIAFGFVALAGILSLATNFQEILTWNWQTLGFSFGLVYALGAMIFVLAIYVSGSATKVVALSAVYPAVTALLLFSINGEIPTLRKVIGIILAVAVGWLMA